MADHPTFEEAYPKYEFSELVRIGILIATWMRQVLHRPKPSRSDPSPAPPADDGLLAD